MSSLLSVVGTIPGYVIYFAAMLLTAAQLTAMLLMLRMKQPAHRILAAAVHLILLVFFLSVLLDYSYASKIVNRPEALLDFELMLLSLPWLLYLVLELISAAVTFHHVRSYARYRDAHPTSDAIRRAVDLLPAGLLVGDADGTVLLANLTMTGLCRELTGELLSDAKRFWQRVEDASDIENASEHLLIRTDAGRTWQFAKGAINVDGKEYDQITATDMTEQYRVTEELSRKNQHLRDVQDRMKAVAAKERSLVAAREIMNARMTVHDRMGAVLLSGKYYLDYPENVKEDELLRLLEYNNTFLLSEAEQPEEAESEGPVQKAMRSARTVGIEVELAGEIPADEGICDLLALAIEQCAANAVRHAGGDRLSVAITEAAGATIIALSNNGSVPEGPIAETGGLAALRSMAAARGASMEVQSAPAFLLTLSIPG